MIRYTLRCENAHVFDAWFKSMDAYDTQASSGHVTCPACGTASVEKTLMAPGVPAKTSSATETLGPREVYNQIREYRAKVLSETEDVGRAFPEQAREMHEGTLEHRAIRGEATPEEVKSLSEDGVPVLPVPPEPPKEN